ncbi:MAG: hypothetical protein Q8L86_18670 [Vicinamibacterales bacterium]|nr:hypothetical protein [Vicinamibacterales bacterium]
MDLTIDGRVIEVDVDEGGPRLSPHTGRTLRNGTITIRATRDHDALMAALPGRVLDSDEGRWLVVRRPRYSFQDASRIAEHVFEIEEFENRAATMLRIADLELTPEKYHEDSSRDDGLEVTARVALTDPKRIDHLREILAADEPVPVIREGVQDAPMQMKIAVLGWSERDAEHVFELQCTELTTSKPSGLIGLHAAFTRPAQVAFLLEWRSAISELLMEKGIVSKEEIVRVEDTATKNVGHRRIKFAQVDDVRAHPFRGEPGE